jgi:hypothetical protein
MSNIGYRVINLDISSQDLQDFILRILDLLENMKSSEGATKAF